MSGAYIASKRRRSRREMDGRARRRSVLEEVRVSELCWLLLVVLLLFQQTLLNITGATAFSYVDEIAVAATVFAAGARAARSKGVALLGRGERVACGIGFALFVWIIVCNFAMGIQTDLVPIAIDVLACSKFVIMVVASLVVFDGNRLVRLLGLVFRTVLVVMVPCWFLNTFLPGGLFLLGQDMGSDVRFGMRSFQFLFGHPETMSIMVLSMMLVMLRDRKQNAVWIGLCLFFIATSLRFKGLAFVAVAAMLLISDKRSIKPAQVLFGAAAIALIGSDQLAFYYGSDSGARAEMTRASLAIASDYFPFGTGFATFGSDVTSDPLYYSVLYIRYGVSNVYGISLASGARWISDTFWPTVLAQFGYFGLVLYVGMMGMLFLSMHIRARGNGKTAVILAVVYLLILSTSGSALFHPNSICIAICLCITVGSCVCGHNVSGK